MMNRLPASSSSGSTVASFSRPRTLSKTGYETSSTTGPTSTALCSTVRASTSSTLRVPQSWRKSFGSPASQASPYGWPASNRLLRPCWNGMECSSESAWTRSMATCIEQSRHKMPASATSLSKRAAEARDPSAADAGHQINGRSSMGCAQSFSENSDVPGAELEVARRCFIVGEEIGHVLREDEVYGSPAPVVDDVDPLPSPIGRRVDRHRRR